LKRRSSEMELVRDIVSKGAPEKQLEYELKTKSQVERETLLDKVLGGSQTIIIPADQVLAMKADLSITWSKLREMRR
jgi:hypothetical protein